MALPVHALPPAGSPSGAFAVSVSATSPLPYVTSSIYVGGTGDVTVKPIGQDSFVTYKAVPGGTVLDIQASYISAGSDLVASHDFQPVTDAHALPGATLGGRGGLRADAQVV